MRIILLLCVKIINKDISIEKLKYTFDTPNIKALNDNIISGAGIDVFSTEPLKSDHPLLSAKNILLTPHNSALTLECRKRMSIETCQNIIYYLTKDKKINKNNLVNREYLDLD